ncbi:AAA family ATPase [Sphingomonas faeni]|jgi:predicted ATP-binding protein involved in virulence|uniref:AAA family ATPase n=1 Tax=Sphingomonas faeni TaxID=185950 RepID=UPI003351F345
MRLQRLELINFRGFEHHTVQLNPGFNLIIGENGAGKTSILEAIAVALGGWLQSFPRTDQRHIRARDVRRVEQNVSGRFRAHPQFPVVVDAIGSVRFDNLLGFEEWQTVRWHRSLENEKGRTTNAGTRELRSIARLASSALRSSGDVTLPVVRYFGAGRLWESVRSTENKRKQTRSHIAETGGRSDDFRDLSDPFYGYRMSVGKRANPADLMRWMGEERRNELDTDEDSDALFLVFQAIRSLLPEIAGVRYDLRRSTMVLEYKDRPGLAFEDMSDGYRNVIALAADLAIKMTMLNPHLGPEALLRTPGVVLIDEIDLHLHPTWQRRVCNDLRRTFPEVQFICTSHSPFIVQSLRSGEELIVLDGEPTNQTANLSLEEVAEGLMGVRHAETGERYRTMKNTARSLLEDMDRRDLSERQRFYEFKRHLAEATAPYADNPAYQAYLEMKLYAKAPPGAE